MFDGLKTKLFGLFPVMLLVLLAATLLAWNDELPSSAGGWWRWAATRKRLSLGHQRDPVQDGVYAISGVFCAIASIIFVARIDSITSNAGTNYETNALAAAIIGGG